jgi:hypothetical protein
MYSRHFNSELPLTHYSKNFDRFFSTPSEYLTTSPSWFNKVHSRRSISEIFPEESVFESILPLKHVSRRNVEIIRRLAVVHPEMINVVVEKMLRPESSSWVEKVLRNVEPETLLSSKLIRKNLPVYLREKIVRRLVKSVLPYTSSRRSIVNEILPESSLLSTSTLFSEPIMSKIMIKELIRRKVEKTVLPTLFHKKSHKLSVNKLVKSMLYKSEEKKVLRKYVKKVVKSVLRHNKKSVSPLSWSTKSLSWSNKSFCMYCSNTCMYNWTPMCNMCNEMCSSNWTPSYFPTKNVNVKLVKKLIKKLSTEELLF